MRVLCCYTDLHPATRKSLAEFAPQAGLVDVSGDDFAYWREIRARWDGTEDLMLIEQDNEIGPDTVASLAACDEPWCSYAYPIFRSKTRLSTGLGCTRISARAQRAVTPRRIAEGFALCAKCSGEGCWWHLDGRIASLLKGCGFSPHVHGNVIHHHEYEVGDEPGGGTPVGWQHGVAGEVARAVDWPYPLGPALNGRQACQIAADVARAISGAGAGVAIAAPAADLHTDKTEQGYLPSYRRIAEQLGPAARVCEIGVFGGGSLAAWQQMFPQGTIAGVDINPGAHWPPGTIQVVAGQDDRHLPAALTEHEYEWDLVVDDASHDGRLTARTLELLWPLVSPGGFYVIEDWFVGFDDYTGPSGPYDSSMADLAKSLLERLRAGSDTETIEYRYGMAIMRKKT